VHRYPVHYSAPRPERFRRVQLAIRILAFIVIGVIGLSLGLVFLVAYLALPVVAAARVAGGKDGAGYLEDDGPRVAAALRWFAAVYAWFGLVTDRIPLRRPEETVRVVIEREGEPEAGSALWRIVTGIPSVLVLWVLGFFGMFVWIWSAIRILVSERVGDTALWYLTGLQRWAVRLLAYQASLVERYPPLSFEDEPPAAEQEREAA
jgi:hypothetical protein